MRIALVDDDPKIVVVLRDILVEAGYEVTSFTDGAELQRALLTRPLPDTIFLDLSMPRATGDDVLISLRSEPERYASLKVVLVTARGGDLASYRKSGPPVVEVLRKPFSLKELFAVLAQVGGAQVCGKF